MMQVSKVRNATGSGRMATHSVFGVFTEEGTQIAIIGWNGSGWEIRKHSDGKIGEIIAKFPQIETAGHTLATAKAWAKNGENWEPRITLHFS